MVKRKKSVRDFRAIQTKIGEAEFFLRRMTETVNRLHDYGCYLSAFLSAFHSAKSRFDRFGGLARNQLAAIHKRMDDDPFVSTLLKARNVEVHDQGISLVQRGHPVTLERWVTRFVPRFVPRYGARFPRPAVRNNLFFAHNISRPVNQFCQEGLRNLINLLTAAAVEG